MDLLHVRLRDGNLRQADLLRAMTGLEAGICGMPVTYGHVGHLVRCPCSMLAGPASVASHAARSLLWPVCMCSQSGARCLGALRPAGMRL